MSGKKAAGIDNTFRRTWNKEEYEEKAAQREKKEKKDSDSALDAKRRKRLERDPLHQGLIVQRANLRSREYGLNLDARLGKSQVVTAQTPLNQQAGYYCSVCDCSLKDSQSYLDHINGRWHNRALGMSMRVERSTVDQVRKRFETLKEKKENGRDDDLYIADGFDKRVLERQEEEERLKEERRERKRRKRAANDEEEEEEEEGDPDMMALMGFGGFGSGKKP